MASTHELATSTAMSVLERGGNAFDAATAGAFVLHVVEPDQNGLGGEVPILTWSASDRRVRVICGQGPTPRAATSERFRDLGHDLIPGSGVLPACVPGAFDAWMLLLRDLGTWRIADALEAAIGYAERGVPVSAGLAQRIAAADRSLRALWPTSAQVYLRDGPPRAGARLRNPALARTLAKIVAEATRASSDREGQIDAARRVWATGSIADAVFRWLTGRPVADLTGHADLALLDADDWSSYRATVEEPFSRTCGELSVCKAGPWSQAPVFLEAHGLLAAADLGSAEHNSAAYIHLVVEACKLALADREAWYGDPRSVDVPIRALLSDAYLSERRALIGDRASTVTSPGAPGGRAPRLPALYRFAAGSGAAGDGSVAASAARGGDTAHISVIDREHNAVAAMPSGGWLQSSPVIPELGFALGTRAQMMWLEEGLPNSLGPRKRPRTTLSPTLAMSDDGRPALAFGSPGGDAQDQWGLQFFLAHVGCGLAIEESVARPTFQSLHVASSFWPRERRPAALQVEGDVGADVIRELRALGHVVEPVPPRSQGWTCVARRDPASGHLSAAASPRGGRGWALTR